MAFWFRSLGPKLIAIAASYVDDVLLASTKTALQEFAKISKSRFDLHIDTSKTLAYVGLLIRLRRDGTRCVSQPKQINRLKLLTPGATFDEFVSARNSLAWMIQSRPDVCCAISFAARVTKYNFTKRAVTYYNVVVKYLRQTADLCLQFPKLDSESLRIAVYTDAGHCNAADGSSQLGYLVLLADKRNRCSIIHYSSKKSNRIVRSTTAGESLAFANGFDAAYAIQADIARMLQKKPPIFMLIDSEILFNIITRRRLTTERRMMIDLQATRNAYANREISNILLIPSEFNPADSLSKINGNSALRELIATAKIGHPISQYVTEPTIANK